MLYIRMEGHDWQGKILPFTAAWRIGMVGLPFKLSDVHNVVEVEADGDELKHIFSHYYPAIPFPVRESNDWTRTVHWYGDMAKFIAGNLL